MINTLYLPELREKLREPPAAELAEFCVVVHAGVTSDFMEGLQPSEVWQVLKHAEPTRRCEIFRFLDPETQSAILEDEDRSEIAELIDTMVPDDRVEVVLEQESVARTIEFVLLGEFAVDVIQKVLNDRPVVERDEDRGSGR